MEDMEEIERLIGDTPRAGTIEDINAALEENMGAIFEKFDTQVERRVEEVVSAALEKALDSTNSATDSNLANQISDMKAEVNALKSLLAITLLGRPSN